MIGGLGFAGAASAGVAFESTAAVTSTQAGTLGATNATVLQVSPDGIGHNLLVPYYSVQEGNGTLLSIVNTDTKNGKAVKVRFRGAANSDDVFDFSLFMSPGDVWTANVSKDTATGLAQIYVPDNTCSLPRRAVLNATKFKTDRVFGATDAAKAGETLEGYVEIFNMADIPPQVPTTAGVVADGGTAASANALFTAIKHTSAGTNPCGLATSDATLPAAVLKLANDPTLTSITGSAAAADREALLNHGFWMPSTGLTGSWTILNIAGASVAWSGNMTAVEARVSAGGAPGLGRVVFSPQKDTTVVATAINSLTSDPLLRNTGVSPSTAIIEAAQYDLPDMSTPYLTAAAITAAGVVAAAPGTTASDAPVLQGKLLTQALAVKNVLNEYVTNSAISAATDWVFSMPTRRYAVGVNYKFAAPATGPSAVFNASAAQQITAGNDVSPYFTAVNTKMGTGGTSGNPTYQACVEPGGNVTAFDQEEATASGEFVVSPGTTKKVVFCGEVSILTFNATSSLQAKIAPKNIDAGFVNGWLNINTAGLANAGLPIVGSSFVKMTGPVVAGKSTNFSLTQPHRFTR
ncbi:hypothetical protein ASD94_12160 [Acidovorax sp. Root70]|nr:hypothetical protein ASD94_12160 [Acidovorax sp. Root70]